ncbi:MAG: PstS family phosphate ABC transporter substrate-binding protein [Deltaproteobacteria bacterium]|nr:PstS family phosphate ABC transporter substrate-binding protein [Deltaproteobacteria bacterium]
MKRVFSYLLAFGLIGFSANAAQTTPSQSLTGQINIDGSATVFPISEGVGEDFQKTQKNLRVKVASSGTGGGFQKFCRGEADITGASRPIEAVELELCAKNKTSFVELPIAYDGIAIVVNPNNTTAKTMTTAQLKKLWEPGSKVKTWGELGGAFAADANLKDKEIKIYGPGPEHGTFDYFTKVINGKEKAIRSDFTASNPDVIVSAIAGNKLSLGYFGYAYYFANKSKLGLVGVDAGKGAVLPDAQTIASGKYAPLSRPIFIYVSEKALARPEVAAFIDYYIQNVSKIAPEVGYVSLGADMYKLVAQRFENKVTGTLYDKSKTISDVSLKTLLSQSNTKKLK